MKANQLVYALLVLIVLAFVPLALAENETNSTDDDNDNTVLNETEEINETVSDNREENPTDNELDSETEEEVSVMTHPSGAEVRMHQLQLRIAHAITVGEAVIDQLEDVSVNSSSNYTVDDLEEIIADLEVLLNQTQSVDYNQSPEELAHQYVSIKKQAIELVAEFRTAVRSMVKASDLPNIRARVQNARSQREERIELRLENAKKQYNAEQIGRFLLASGIVDEELIAQIRSGEVSKEEVQLRIKTRLEGLSEEDKQEIRVKLREESAKRTLLTQEVRTRVREDGLEVRSEIRERQSERLGELAINAENRGRGNAADTLNSASGRLQQRSDRLEERSNNLEQRRLDRIRDESGNSGSSDENETDDNGDDSNEQ